MFENIKDRYDRGWIRADQLQRYVEFGIITQTQANEISGAV